MPPKKRPLCHDASKIQYLQVACAKYRQHRLSQTPFCCSKKSTTILHSYTIGPQSCTSFWRKDRFVITLPRYNSCKWERHCGGSKWPRCFLRNQIDTMIVSQFDFDWTIGKSATWFAIARHPIPNIGNTGLSEISIANIGYSKRQFVFMKSRPLYYRIVPLSPSHAHPSEEKTVLSHLFQDTILASGSATAEARNDQGVF